MKGCDYTDNLKENKNLELEATNSRLEDENSQTSSSNIIAQDTKNVYPENWLFRDEKQTKIFEGGDYNMEKEELTPMQKAFHNVCAKEHEQGVLEDNKILPCIVDRGEYHITNSGIDVIKLICNVNDGSSYLKQIEDLFIFGNGYIETTLMRLKTVLTRFQYDLTDNDVKDMNSIVEAINRLHGRNARVKQYTHNDDKRYWFYTA